MAQYQAGTYNGTLTKAVCSESNSGSPQFVLRFTLAYYSQGGEWVEIEQTDRNLYLSMAGGAKDYTIKKLKALGIGVDGPPNMTEDPQSGEMILDLPSSIGDELIELSCKHEMYNGAEKERWDLANWGGGGGMGQKASNETVAKLKTMWA